MAFMAFMETYEDTHPYPWHKVQVIKCVIITLDVLISHGSTLKPSPFSNIYLNSSSIPLLCHLVHEAALDVWQLITVKEGWIDCEENQNILDTFGFFELSSADIMCTGACSRFIAIPLYILALVSIICNIMLFFPDFKTSYAVADTKGEEEQITPEVKYMGGLIGGGIMVSRSG